jgi:hypothetical protein
MMSNSSLSLQPSSLVLARMVLAAAFLIGLGAYWFPFINIIGSCSVGTYANASRVLVLLLLGLAGGLLQWKRIPIFGGVGTLSGWLADIFFSLNWPATFHCSHQLLPLEAIILYVFIALPSWLGFSIGKLLESSLKTRLLPSRQHSLAYALIALSSVIAFLSSNLLPLELRANERRAQETLGKLAWAQFSFQASHPETGFSCKLSELSKEFSTTWPTSNKSGMVYEDAYEGGYHYRLWCYQDATPRVNFAIEASPFCVPDCGNVTYCVNRTGNIHALPRSASKGRGRNCWDEGVVVGSIYK